MIVRTEDLSEKININYIINISEIDNKKLTTIGNKDMENKGILNSFLSFYYMQCVYTTYVCMYVYFR